MCLSDFKFKLHVCIRLVNYEIWLSIGKNNKAEQIKKEKKNLGLLTYQHCMLLFTQPRSWPSVRAVMIIIRTNWVLWFSQTQRCNVNISHSGRDTATPAPRCPLLSAGRWIWLQTLLICGKMAQIMCCTFDVYTYDETIVVDRLRDGRPSSSHCLTFWRLCT